MIKLIIGTRAELIKIFPIIYELEKNKMDFYIYATGQHNLNKLLEKLNIDKDNFSYILPPREGFKLKIKSVIPFLSESIIRIKRIINKKDLVVVHGDTLSTLIATLASKYKKAKVFHIEAGLRSWDPFEPFPEEIIRWSVDCLSDVLFAVSKTSYKNIKKQFPWKTKIYTVGNTIIDSALIAYKSKTYVDLPNEDYGIVSIHRHENLSKKWRLMKIVKILKEVSKKITLYFFLYENTKIALKKYDLLKYLENNKNIILHPPLDYFSFIKWIANSKIILTDGGSIQEESIIFKVPVLILRLKTERVEGLKTGINFLTKLDINKSIEIINYVLNKDFSKLNVKNPYGKPGVSKKIVSILKEYLD